MNNSAFSKDSKPLVSIIIPIYKVENFIRDCINSVINQTYTNIEILLIDDGSPDNCPEICNEYGKKDDRIVVIHKENGGLSDARNKGIEIAKGDYFIFLDSDDIINLQMIEILMQPLIKDSTNKISACNYKQINEDFTLINESLNTNEYNLTLNIQNLNIQEYYKIPLWVTAWGKIYSRHLFDKIRYPINRLHEDEFTTYKLLYEAKNICFIDLPLYYYRKRNTSIMKSLKTKNLIDVHDAFVERINFFLSKNEKELALTALKSLLNYNVLLYADPRRSIVTKEIKKQFKKSIVQNKWLVINFKDKIIFYLKTYYPILFRRRNELRYKQGNIFN